jgi:hypothetical protein
MFPGRSGALFVIGFNDSPKSLWSVNLHDPASGAKLGDLPTDCNAASLCWTGDRLFAVSHGSRDEGGVWRIDPGSPSSETAPYGLLGNLPGYYGPNVAWDGTGMLSVQTVSIRKRPLWRFDPDDLSSTTAPYGFLGNLPSDLDHPLPPNRPTRWAMIRGLTWTPGGLLVSALVGVSNVRRYELWRIDPGNPTSKTAPYGFLGNLPGDGGDFDDIRWTGDGLLGIGRVYITLSDGTNTSRQSLWRLDPDNLSGAVKVGDFPHDGNQDPGGIGYTSGLAWIP